MKKVQTKNKTKGLFGLFAAFALAIGVGVSLAQKQAVLTKAADFVISNMVTSGNKYLITASTGGTTYYLPTGNHSSAPTATALNMSSVRESDAWTFTGNEDDGYKIHDDAGYILYTTDTNNGVRSNKTSEVVWHKVDSTWKVTGINNRRLALYNTQDWRTYANTTNGTQTIVLYELITQQGPQPESMELDVDTLTLDILDTHQLVPRFEPEGAMAGVSYTITASNPVGVISVTAAGVITALKTGTATISAETTDGSGLDAGVNVTVTANYSSSIMTPAEAQELAIGADVMVRGKVVADIKNAGSYAIQVADRGIMTYGINNLTVGNDVIIAGKMAAYQGMPQISNATSVIDLGPSTTTVTPKVITSVSQFTANLSGTLVQINDMEYDGGTFSTSAASNVDLVLAGDDIVLRSTKDVPIAAMNAANAIFNSTGPDDVLNVTTVAGWFNGAQLLFSEETIIQKIEPVFGALDHIALNTANVKTSYFVGEAFSLEGLVVTAYDVANLAKIVTAEATSSLASGYAFVAGDIGSKTITITYEDGEVEKTETFDITITPVPAGTKVIMSYSGSTDNMVPGNNASTVGLDPSIFNVVSTEREINPLHVGLNGNGEIRLYGSNNADGNGNVLTVSISEAYVISSFKISFGGTIAPALIKGGTETLHDGALTKNTSLEFKNRVDSEFSIKNIVKSATTQIYILSIEIYYEPVSDPVYEEAKVFADYIMAFDGGNAQGMSDSFATCEDNLLDAMIEWGGLSAEAKDLFETHADFASARQRLMNWLLANGFDSFDDLDVDGSGLVSQNKDSNSLTATIIIGVIGLTTLTGYYFLKKKKEA